MSLLQLLDFLFSLPKIMTSPTASTPLLGPTELDFGHNHYANRSNWLRAGVLGASDGLVSNGSLILSVLAASQPSHIVILTGLSSLVAGALSMALGEYISVSSQRDSEKADIRIETEEQEDQGATENEELVAIYMSKGLCEATARICADELSLLGNFMMIF